jgi:hypothetical protein
VREPLSEMELTAILALSAEREATMLTRKIVAQAFKHLHLGDTARALSALDSALNDDPCIRWQRYPLGK